MEINIKYNRIVNEYANRILRDVNYQSSLGGMIAGWPTVTLKEHEVRVLLVFLQEMDDELYMLNCFIEEGGLK